MVTVKSKRLILIALAGSLIVLGVGILVATSFFTNRTTTEEVVPAPDSSVVLRESQRKLLSTPLKLGMTDEVYAAEVARLAVEADTISIGAECSMDPLIIKMKEGSILKIDNKDSAEHMLAFEDQNFFAVSAGFVREINITEVFGKGEGIYRYRCGDRSLEETVGIMYVVK